MDRFIVNYKGLAFALLLLVAAALGISLFLPFLPALLWATVLSVLMAPMCRRFERRFSNSRWLKGQGPRTAASLVTTLLALVIICIPFVVIGLGLFIQVENVSSKLAAKAPAGQNVFTLDGLISEVDSALKPLAERVGAKDFSLKLYVEDHKEQIVQSLRAPVQKFATQAGIMLLTLVIALLTMFFMLRDGDRLIEPTVDLTPLPREKTMDLLSRVGETIHAVFIGTVLVAIIQGMIIGIAYAFAGVPNALLLGVLSMVLCIVPLLGAPVLYFPIGLALLFAGNYGGAAIVLLTGTLVVSQIDNILKPFLIGGRVNLHPMAIFFSILGGVILTGPIGVMAGPMLLTAILALLDVLRETVAGRQEGVGVEG